MQNWKSFIANLSHHPGVYEMLDDDGKVIYIGKAKNLKKRLASYFSTRVKDLKTSSLVKQIKTIHTTITNSETEAVLLECNLIKKYRPRYNILLRDDKSYPYILISNHPYPRLDLYRGTRKKNGLYFGPYPSAYAVRETISLIQKIFRIRTCTDSFFASRTRPCLLHPIGRCTGPCVDLISKADYENSVHLAVNFLEGKDEYVLHQLQTRMEAASSTLNFELAAQYRDQIMRVRHIQEKQYVNVGEGNADMLGFAAANNTACIHLLSIRGGQVLGSQSYFPIVPPHAEVKEIISAFISQHYLNHPSHVESIPKQIITPAEFEDRKLLEHALSYHAKQKVQILHPLRGNRKKWLMLSTTNAKQSLSAHLLNKATIEERMFALQKTLNLLFLPERIECFDISHSSGEATVASCVVFTREGPLKNQYRRFNITDITPGDDLAAMRQVLLRRFKRLQQDQINLPDIVLIDGGATQLGVAKTVAKELNLTKLFLIGVSKGPDRKPGFETLHFLDASPMHLPQDSMALHFIQQIRDEAHRFAITGHRKQRDKARRHSLLETIPGVGAKRRRDLLRFFGGIQGLAHASLEELMKVPGINRSLAERIFAMLHDATL